MIFDALDTGITYTIYLLLLPALDYSAAYAVSCIVGIGIAYLLSARLVFNVDVKWPTFRQER